jgi:hypothetical protein
MLNILYYNRNLLAVAAAVVIGVCAFQAMPNAEVELHQIVSAAGAPRDTGTQNPFLDSAKQQNAGGTVSAHPAFALNLR